MICSRVIRVDELPKPDWGARAFVRARRLVGDARSLREEMRILLQLAIGTYQDASR